MTKTLSGLITDPRLLLEGPRVDSCVLSLMVLDTSEATTRAWIERRLQLCLPIRNRAQIPSGRHQIAPTSRE